MSKVNVAQRQMVVPPEYFSKLKPSCKAFEKVIKIQPLQTAFSSQTVPVKITVDLPNINFRLSEIYLEAAVTVNISSTDVKDTYAAVQPTICQWGASMVNQVRLTSGSTEVLNYRAVNTRYNWQQNLMTNSLYRNGETYNNVTPVVYTALAQYQTFRFPLSALPTDFFSLENGIWPGQHVKRCALEVYWEAPQYFIYAAGTIVGTLTFSYAVTGFNVQVICVSDPTLDQMISTRGMCINYLEFYWFQQPITTAAQQVIQVPISFSSVRGILYGIRRVADLTSQTLATKLQLMSSECTDPVSCDLRINSQKRQDDVFIGAEQLVPETWRIFPIAKFADYYNTLAVNKTTHSMYGLLAGQAYCTSCISGLDSQNITSQLYLEFTLTSALSTASILDIFIIHDRAITITDKSMYIDE